MLHMLHIMEEPYELLQLLTATACSGYLGVLFAGNTLDAMAPIYLSGAVLAKKENADLVHRSYANMSYFEPATAFFCKGAAACAMAGTLAQAYVKGGFAPALAWQASALSCVPFMVKCYGGKTVDGLSVSKEAKTVWAAAKAACLTELEHEAETLRVLKLGRLWGGCCVAVACCVQVFRTVTRQ
ncbi:hypothetical protein FOA52_009099 [Chlamydomonas sp. UWO 241]|nr:hypothetical protein FOA52_009099 [Chlamydomonas sp. UWO 241]